MDFSQEMDALADFISEKEMVLPSLISNLSDATVPQERLHSIRLIIRFLPSCQQEQLEEMLHFVLPSLSTTLQEVLDSNVTILKRDLNTARCLMELRENIEIAANLFHVCSEIFDYMTQLKSIQYQYVQSIPLNVADMVLMSFRHCKTSQEVYLNNFDANEEVVNLFRKTQEVHVKFLKWLEDILILDTLIADSYIVLNNGIIVAISEVLSGMNLKSLADNWKSYTAVTQKYADMLIQGNYDLFLPLKCLKEEIQRKIVEIHEINPHDHKQVSQVVKIANFLIKVLLKLCDIFCRLIDVLSKELLEICTVIYSYTPYYFQNCHYPNEVISLVRSVYDNYKVFVNHLLESHDLLKILLNEEYVFIYKEQFGSIELLNDILNGVLISRNKFPDNYANQDHYKLLQLIFNRIQFSSADFLINSNLYESLMINIVLTSFLLSGRSYSLLEILLLKNVLQDKFWPAFLAIDVWCLVLRNASLATCMETVMYLAKKMTECNFGMFSHRPEFVYMKILIWRMHQMIPLNRRTDLLASFKPIDHLFLWQTLGFHNIHMTQRCFFEPLFDSIYEYTESIQNLPAANFIKLMETLDAISSLDHNCFGLHSTKICQVVADLWNFSLSNLTVSGNNFLKYFFKKLCNITRIFLQYFSNDILLVVLGQLRQLSISTDYKLLILDALNALSFKRIDNSLEQNTILGEIAGLLELVLQDTNPVIRELALEECHSFVTNSPHDQIINCVIINLKNTKYDVNPFLQKTIASSLVSFQYYKLIDEIQFEHKCIMWSKSYTPIRTDESQICSRHFDTFPATKDRKELTEWNQKQQSASVRVRKPPTESNQQQSKKVKVEEVYEGEVDSLINSIKSDMKNLANVLKKESLTQKNVKDINYIVTQLHSFSQK